MKLLSVKINAKNVVITFVAMVRVSQLGSTSGGDNLDKMAKNCMKMIKPAYLDQNSGRRHGVGQANFSGSGGDPPPKSPPIGETLMVVFV